MRKPRKPRHDLYAAYREKSGWWLAAWRDHAGLTLDDMAAELEMTKGYVSDLETGAVREGRAPTRFNRDTLEKAAKAIGENAGHLIDVNPYTMWVNEERLSEAVRRLEPDDRDAVLDMAERLAKKADAA